jgi:Amt family ammonium transporter
MLGSLAIGFWGIPALLGTETGGLFIDGSLSLLGSQLFGVIVVTIWAAATAAAVFIPLKAAGLLRLDTEGEEMGIDAFEHDASLYGDILPVPGKVSAGD